MQHHSFFYFVKLLAAGMIAVASPVLAKAPVKAVAKASEKLVAKAPAPAVAPSTAPVEAPAAKAVPSQTSAPATSANTAEPPQLDKVPAPTNVPAPAEPETPAPQEQAAAPAEAPQEVAAQAQAQQPAVPEPAAQQAPASPQAAAPPDQEEAPQVAAAQAAAAPSEDDKFFQIEDVSLNPFVYDSSQSRRDPFRSPRSKSRRIAATVEGEDGGGPENTVLLPLQQFDVSELRLIGIIWGVDEPQAMVMDPKNTTHMIRVDQRVGRNSGYVSSIRENEVVVIEQEEVDGEMVKIPRVLSLVAK